MQIPIYDAPTGIEREEMEFETWVQSEEARSKISFWSQRPCIVAPTSIRGRNGFEHAAKRAAEAGWPVHLRRSGGGAVYHHQGVLCVGIYLKSSETELTIEAGYRCLADLIIQAGAAFGVNMTTGAAPNAPCDGRFNISVDGRKIAGLAMRSRTVKKCANMLVHAYFHVDGPLEEPLAVIEMFEHALGVGCSYPPHASVALSELAAPQAPLMALFADQLATGFESFARRWDSRLSETI